MIGEINTHILSDYVDIFWTICPQPENIKIE